MARTTLRWALKECRRDNISAWRRWAESPRIAGSTAPPAALCLCILTAPAWAAMTDWTVTVQRPTWNSTALNKPTRRPTITGRLKTEAHSPGSLYEEDCDDPAFPFPVLTWSAPLLTDDPAQSRRDRDPAEVTSSRVGGGTTIQRLLSAAPSAPRSRRPLRTVLRSTPRRSSLGRAPHSNGSAGAIKHFAIACLVPSPLIKLCPDPLVTNGCEMGIRLQPPTSNAPFASTTISFHNCSQSTVSSRRCHCAWAWNGEVTSLQCGVHVVKQDRVTE